MPREIMFQLILQHLHHNEFNRTAQNLTAESGVNRIFPFLYLLLYNNYCIIYFIII